MGTGGRADRGRVPRGLLRAWRVGIRGLARLRAGSLAPSRRGCAGPWLRAAGPGRTHPGSLGAAGRALALDQTSEQALGASLRCLSLLGDRSGALELYERFAARVKEEVGTDPGEETRALVDRIRRERSLRPEGASEEPTAKARFGRLSRGAPAELGRLLQAVSRVGGRSGLRRCWSSKASRASGRPGCWRSCWHASGSTGSPSPRRARWKRIATSPGADCSPWPEAVSRRPSGIGAAPPRGSRGLRGGAPGVAASDSQASTPSRPTPSVARSSRRSASRPRSAPSSLALDDAQWLDRDTALELVRDPP